jgi:hypothetical protein
MTDPYELLGVPHGATPQEVRSAHDRLAAGCDPNRAHRLREARDAVLHDLELLTILDSPLTLELPPATARPAEAPVHDNFDLTEALQTAPATTIRLTAAALWQLALAGHEADAYRGLATLVEARDASEDVYLRLYWLLTLRPDLEAAHAPAEWLVRGLHAVGVGGSLWELYRRVVAEDAHEALSPRCAELLAVPAESDHLVELVQLRWRAAGDARRWNIVSSDLDVLRERSPAANAGAWARVWSVALDHLIWSDEKVPRKLAAHCYQAQGEIPSDQFAVAEARKHANSLRDLAAGWRKLRSEPDVPPPLLALIPPS